MQRGKRATEEQKEFLIDFLNQNRDFANDRLFSIHKYYFCRLFTHYQYLFLLLDLKQQMVPQTPA